MTKIIIFLFSIIFLFAENIEVFGVKSKIKDNKVIVYNGLLIKDGMLVSADKIEYDKILNIIKANGNIYINYDKYDYILANKVIIDLKTNGISAEPFFLFNFKDNSWIRSDEVKNRGEWYHGKYSIASTCEITNPDWKIVSSSINYNKQTKWIDLYNPTLYIYKVPVLYLPYLGFSLNKSRSSGFLTPLVGYSANEGLLLTTPYYHTLGISADLEIEPTIRTKRGKGIYSTFRFVHSPTSYGEFKIGSFKDNESYQTKYDLANQTHTGWSFLYTNNSLLRNNDKLYINLKNANDTEYFYLDAYNYEFKTVNTKILTSKINYYTYKDYNYLGIYSTYFKDTSKISNEDTMQILPQINYHRFNDNFYGNFSYSIDANIYNYTRKKGYKAIKKSIVIPLNYNISFFDDYLKFAITEQLNTTQVDISDNHTAKLTRLDTFLKVYSNLSKKYPNFIHHIATSLTFGMDNYFNYNNVETDYIDTSLMKKSISLKLYQYLISSNWQIDHKLSEVYYLDDDNVNSKYSALLNDISIRYYSYYLRDSNKYSIDDEKVNYNSITLGYQDSRKKLEGSFIYQRELSNISKSKSYALNGYWKYDGLHKLFASYNYDLVLDMTKYYLIGVSMKKKCWNYSISYKKETLPLLTNDGISSIIQKTIYFQIELVPLGGVEQQYKFNNKKG